MREGRFVVGSRPQARGADAEESALRQRIAVAVETRRSAVRGRCCQRNQTKECGQKCEAQAHGWSLTVVSTTGVQSHLECIRWRGCGPSKLQGGHEAALPAFPYVLHRRDL